MQPVMEDHFARIAPSYEDIRLTDVEPVLSILPFLCSGPLKGIEGRLIRRKNIDRLVLQVHVLGQAVSTEIDAALLEVID